MSTLTTTEPTEPTKNTRLASPSSADPQAALAAAMNLAALNPEQLAEAGRSLLAAEARYDRMSGICGILAGLVMLEGKRRLEHGGFLEWLGGNFSKLNRGSTLEFKKSADYRTCSYRMRVAEEFLGKQKRTATFGAEQLLLSEFAAHLAAENASAMDMENPVVSAVAEYVDGRSFRQLRDGLEAKPRGGNQRRDDSGPAHEPTREELEVHLLKWANDFSKAAPWSNKSWRLLRDDRLRVLRDFLEGKAEEITAWLALPQMRREAMTLEELHD